MMDDEEIEVSAVVEEEEVISEGQVDALKGDKGDTGPQGPQGEPGYTPVKGVDYFTEEDKTELLSGVEAEIDELDRTKADITDIPDVSNFITKEVNNLTNYTLKTATGSLIDLEINQSTYVVTLSLKDIDGNVISTDTIDLPLESVVIGGTFDSVNKKIVLTLENGNTVDIPVGDLVAGLQTEITSSNKLASDLVDDTNSGNKFVTTSEKTAWNAKLDQSDLADYVKNTDYPTTTKTGVIRTGYGTSVDQYGALYANTLSYANYGNAGNNTFIGKGTLESVINNKLYTKTQVDESQAEQDAEVQALQDKVDLLESMIPTDTATGESITLTDSAKYPFKEFNVSGNTKQATAILPDEYQQVDYIESSGTQYIDTGIAPSEDLSLKYKTLLNNSYMGSLFGANKGNYQYTIATGISNNIPYEYFRIFTEIATSLINGNKVYEAEIQPNKLIYNGNEYSLGTQNVETYTNSLYLFARNIDGVASNFGSRRIYYFKMYVSDVLTRDFIPCYRKSDNVVGLYDLVNKTFYTNAGTGAFTYGTAVTLPNPDFPIKVENVGNNLNLFDKDNVKKINYYFERNGDTLKYNVTNKIVYIPCQGNTTYTVSRQVLNNMFQLATTEVLPASGVVVSDFIAGDSTTEFLTLKTSPNSKYLLYRCSNKTTDDMAAIYAGIKIEKNSQPTPYSPYNCGSIGAKVENKNLFDDTLEVGSINSSGENVYNTGQSRNHDYILLKPNTEYTVSTSVQCNIGLRFYDKNKTFLSNMSATGSPRTFTMSENAYYLRIVMTTNNLTNSVQIEEGSTATSYEPYEEQTATFHLPEGMEMCKIGTYQDSFVYQGGKWYKNKKINKIVFNGTENWTLNSNYEGRYRYTLNVDDAINYSVNTGTDISAISDRFLGVQTAQWSTTLNSITVISNKRILIATELTTVTAFKSLLQEKNATTYYVLTNPVLQEITDTTLISDLESLKNLYSYKGTTYISSTNEPSPVFEVVYRKSLG